METFFSGSWGRSRSRATGVDYEQGKDHFCHLLSSTHARPLIFDLMRCIVARCSLPQLTYLFTSLESAAHRDVLSKLHKAPLSTWTSRRVTSRLARSNTPQNKQLFRTTSQVINSPQEVQTSALNTSPPETRDSTAHAHTTHECSSSRVHTPTRRHMTRESACPPVPTLNDSQITRPSPAVLHFATWFQDLDHDWQQKECLQLLVTNLNGEELYYLATLLMSRQFCDFISELPLNLVVELMSYVPAKDILKNCTLVSRAWNKQCSCESVWRRKVNQRRMGLPVTDHGLSWKELYLKDLMLRKNWARGKYSTQDLDCNKVLCVRLRGDHIITGSADKSVRVWRASTGSCERHWTGHTRAVWSVCFYGKSFIISGSGDHSIKIWSTRTGNCERTLRGHSGCVWALQVNSGLLISGAHDNMVNI